MLFTFGIRNLIKYLYIVTTFFIVYCSFLLITKINFICSDAISNSLQKLNFTLYFEFYII